MYGCAALLTAVLFICGCASSPAGREFNPHSKEPFLFRYNGTQSEMLTALKSILAGEGYVILIDDAGFGFLATDSKLLEVDEKNNVEDTARVLKIHLVQYGKIIFFYSVDPEKGWISIKMRCYLRLVLIRLD
ncbi:MAG: hypothetical protein JW969_20850, partial [Spirochaetales bacterium]|nr:hypothetical protein [Spirochaetales bacterium]